MPARSLAAWRLGAEATATGPQGPGWYVAADGAGSELWAVIATAKADKSGSAYRLVVSAPGAGRAWAHPRHQPHRLGRGRAGRRVRRGVGQLWRTADGGRSWSQLRGAPAPGQVSEQLGLLGERLIVSGARLMRSDDHGVTWRVQHDEPVLATDGEWVITGQTGAAGWASSAETPSSGADLCPRATAPRPSPGAPKVCGSWPTKRARAALSSSSAATAA
ncbi:MAG: hypothetical protein IPI35_21155 [Deltaproteobacteria bacterium]|nr:hypothetical protein [Deltaproteobacteria bacterium]